MRNKLPTQQNQIMLFTEPHKVSIELLDQPRPLFFAYFIFVEKHGMLIMKKPVILRQIFRKQGRVLE